MNKKKLNKVISLALAALFVDSSCLALVPYKTNPTKEMILGVPRKRPVNDGSLQKNSGSMLIPLISVPVFVAAAAILAGMSKKSDLPEGNPDNPGMPSETPDEEKPAPEEETPKFVDMYQQARFVLGQPCLRDYAIAYLNNCVGLSERSCPSSYYPLYLGFDGNFVAFEDLDTMKKKAFLVNPSDALIHAFLKGFHREEEAQEAVEAWNEQNKNLNAGEKYNILVKLIGLPINTENDICDLAKALIDTNIVNKSNCVSIGVTSFKDKQNRICVAMFGDSKDKLSYKKIVTSCMKGLKLCFGKTFDTCGTSNTEWGDDTEDYYVINSTSVKNVRTKNEYKIC